MRRLILVLAVLSLVYSLPNSHLIKNVPYHSQITNWSCGDGSLEMVLNYYGPDVDQMSIIDVARSAAHEGTLSLDIIRTLHYSRLSSSIGTAFPNATTVNGFPGHPRGLAGFWRDSQTPWLDDALSIVAQDVPIICLTHLSPNGTRDGHFRVLIGYDLDAQTVSLWDPWNRNGNPAFLVWPIATFLKAWNYTENPPTPRINPFFGAIGYPWQITSEVEQISPTKLHLHVKVTYPTFVMMVKPETPASMVLVSARLSDNLAFSSSNFSSVTFPQLNRGESVSVTWSLDCLMSGQCSKESVTVVAEGIIQGSVPVEPMNSHMDYPNYDFVDVIGAESVVPISFK